MGTLGAVTPLSREQNKERRRNSSAANKNTDKKRNDALTFDNYTSQSPGD